jgi:Domain of unknown function (DUF397)
MLSTLDWKRSSFCGGGGNNCVEIAVRDDDGIAIRDSVYPVPIIKTSKTALATFLAGVRDGMVGGQPY